MAHAVATEPKRLMRRVPRTNRHGLSARPTNSLCANYGRPAGKEGGDGFTEPAAHALPVPVGTTQTAASGRAGLARTAVPSGTSADQTALQYALAVGDRHGGRRRAPRT